MDFSKEIRFGKKKADEPNKVAGGDAGARPADAPATVNAVDASAANGASKATKPVKGNRAFTLTTHKDTFPTKTHINLVQSDASRSSRATEVLLFILLLLLIAAFAKFAVIDPLASGMESSRRVEGLQGQLNELQAANANKEGLAQEYSKYVVKGLTPEEQALTNRNDIIDLLRSKVMSFGALSSLKVAGNEVTVTCANVGLNEVSSLVQALESDNRVSYVTVSTAQGTEAKGSSATITITMKGADEIAALEQEGATNG